MEEFCSVFLNVVIIKWRNLLNISNIAVLWFCFVPDILLGTYFKIFKSKIALQMYTTNRLKI